MSTPQAVDARALEVVEPTADEALPARAGDSAQAIEARDAQPTHQPDVPPDYQRIRYPYRRHPDQDLAIPARHPVVVVGAGPVGLSLAIDLALQQVPVVLLNDDGRLSVGSRALCFSKRSLDIFDRLGCGQRLVDRGVSWEVGRVFFRDEQVYQFHLAADGGQQRPAFVNLPQYEVEGALVERAMALPLLDLRWHHRVVDLGAQAGDLRADDDDIGHAPSTRDAAPTTAAATADGPVALRIETPDGDYTLLADHVVACDGARSTIRQRLGLDSQGRRFQDRFLIADVRMRAPFPAERWFWFDPPFHPGRSVLLHRQPDDVWRIDFQLGWDADPVLEQQPERVLPRVRALMAQASRAAGGDGVTPEIELVWASVYTFACTRLARFRHGRVLFAGDAAHGVSPFGARGANSGVQDADNLAWKLASVLRGDASDALLDSYAHEREAAADDNIRHSSRATDFITPKSEISQVFRDAVLDLARDVDFARRLVNSGRLSVPSVLADSPLNTAEPDEETTFSGPMQLGAVAMDAPVMVNGQPDWLLRHTQPGRFTVLVFAIEPGTSAPLSTQAVLDGLKPAFDGLPNPTVLVIQDPQAPPLPAMDVPVLIDAQDLMRERYDGRPGTMVLLRPDQHVCARWRRADPVRLAAAVRRALGKPE